MTNLENNTIAIEVPSDATQWKIETLKENEEFEGEKILMFDNLDYIKLPSSDFKILGTVDAENISFDVEPYIKKAGSASFGWRADGGKIKETDFFFDYNHKIPQPVSFILTSSKESFRSLLQSKGIDLNKPNVKYVILLKL